jgi:hypothetical protein
LAPAAGGEKAGLVMTMPWLRRRAASVGPSWRAQTQRPFLRDSVYAPRPAEGSTLFLGQFAAYVLLMGFAYTAQSGLLKALGNVYAVVIFSLVAFAWLTRRYPPASWVTPVFVAYATYLAGIVCGLAVNPDKILWGDLIKVSITPAFLFFGAAFERARAAAGAPQLSHQANVRWMFALLVLVPLLTWGAQLLQSGFEVDGVRETSIFANRNNAAVYAITVLGLLTVIRGQPIGGVWGVLLFVVVGAMFLTLGVFLAVVLALALMVGRRRELVLLGLLLLVGVLGYGIAPEFGPFKRITPVLDSVRLLLEGRIDLHTVTFGDLVVLLKTQDLSFLFRLKHWTDLWVLFSNADIYQWLFGQGLGSSVWLSELRLVPHNDYIRVGFELGLVTLAAWIVMLVAVMVRCGRRWETVPLMVVVIYLFSENLINNYVAMAFFYFSAGAVAERVGAMKKAARPDTAAQAVAAPPALEP